MMPLKSKPASHQAGLPTLVFEGKQRFPVRSKRQEKIFMAHKYIEKALFLC